MTEKPEYERLRYSIAWPFVCVGGSLAALGGGQYTLTLTPHTALTYGFVAWLIGMVIGCVRWGLLANIVLEAKVKQDHNG